jgi:hypothetical protein
MKELGAYGLLIALRTNWWLGRSLREWSSITFAEFGDALTQLI